MSGININQGSDESTQFDSCLLNVHFNCIYIVLSCLVTCLTERSASPRALLTCFIPFPPPPSFLTSFKCLCQGEKALLMELCWDCYGNFSLASVRSVIQSPSDSYSILKWKTTHPFPPLMCSADRWRPIWWQIPKYLYPLTLRRYEQVIGNVMHWVYE